MKNLLVAVYPSKKQKKNAAFKTIKELIYYL